MPQWEAREFGVISPRQKGARSERTCHLMHINVDTAFETQSFSLFFFFLNGVQKAQKGSEDKSFIAAAAAAAPWKNK